MTINFSIDNQGNIEPTTEQQAETKEEVNFSANGFTVYVYDASGVRTTDLFGTAEGSAIDPSAWPLEISASSGTFTLSTCSGGPSCEEALRAGNPQAKKAPAGSPKAGVILSGNRGNGTIRIGTK